MDLSKLPRMSKTDRPPNDPEDAPIAAAPPAAGAAPLADVPPAPETRGAYCDRCGVALRPGARFCDGCGAPILEYRPAGADPGMGAEAWLSLAIGAIVLFLYPRFFQWALHLADIPPVTDSATGATIPYPKSAFFWQDFGPALFGVTLILEGLALVFVRRKGVVLASLVLTAIAAVVNLWAIVYTTGIIGFPIMSAIAVAYCVYILMSQWRLFRQYTARG